MTDGGPIRVETGAQPALRLLVVDDSVDDFDLLVRVLRKAGIEPQATRVGSEPGLREALSDGRWDAVVVDHVIPGYSGPQALQLLQSQAPDLAVVVVSGKVDEEVIAADLRLGADDYVFKSGLSRLVPAIEQARHAAAGRRDRRRAEEALRASEARYRRMVDQASEGVWAMDRDHVTTFVNERMAQMLGVGPDDMLGRPIADFMFPEDLDDHRRQMAIRHAGRSSHYERRFRHRDGREVLTIVAATPVRDADGEFDGSFALFTDITDRVRAEHELADSQARLASILDAAPAAIGLVRDRILLEVNEHMCAMLGYRKDELVGQSARLLYPSEEEFERVGREKYAQIERTGRGSVETRWRSKHGDDMEIMLSSAVVDPSDPSRGITFTAFDITDRLWAERDLAAQRDLLSTVFDSAPYAVMVLDRELRVRRANRALRESIARSDHQDALADLLCGEAIECAADPETQCGEGVACPRCSVRSLVGRTLETGESSLDVEGRLILRRNGSVEDADVLLSAAPVLVDGELLCLVTVADVTERSRAVRALGESEARYRRVVEGTSEGLLELDAEYRIVAVNDRWLEMMGYGRADVLGRRVHDFLFDEDLPDLKANIELRRQGIAGRHERRFRRADGTELWAVISAVPRMAGDGAFGGVVALWLDITEEKRAVRALAEHEAALRAILDAAQETVFMVDRQGVILVANTTMAERLGKRTEDVIGRPIADLLPDGLFARRWQVVERVLSSGIPETFEDERDGRWLEHAVYPVKDREGVVERLAIYARDISDRRRSERLLGEHAERLRRTVEGAVDAMGSVVEMRDPYTAGHERRVTALAVEVARRLGLPEQRVEGLRLAGSVHDIGKIAVPAEILSKPGQLQEYEMNLVRTHAQVGHDVLAAIDFEQPVAEIVLQHHEKLDGSGYPGGLHGDEILLEARILTVADVVEAMSSHRPYRAALGMSAALAEIGEGAGTRYDADAVAACEEAIADGFTFDPER
jgi:PAS domain S-box-containing protein/putative nucleotidyltransferase with HDIG domain